MTSMKRPAATAAFAVALFLAGAGASPAIADDCGSLVGERPDPIAGTLCALGVVDCSQDSPQGPSVPVASQKPQNLEVRPNRVYGSDLAGWELVWTIADDFPRNVLTGACVYHSHPASGQVSDWCDDQTTYAAAGTCFGVAGAASFDCPSGAHRYKVRFRTSCNIILPWSDTVEHTE